MLEQLLFCVVFDWEWALAPFWIQKNHKSEVNVRVWAAIPLSHQGPLSQHWSYPQHRPRQRDWGAVKQRQCELILTAGVGSAVDVGCFPSDFKVIRDGNFELLGGPVGTPQSCNQHTQARVTKAVKRFCMRWGKFPTRRLPYNYFVAVPALAR